MPRDVTITSPYQGLYPKGLLPEHSFWKQTEGMFTGKRGIIISAWALRCLFCWDGFARPEVVERSNVSELHAFLFVTIILSFFLQWGVVAECVIPKFHHSTIRCWE